MAFRRIQRNGDVCGNCFRRLRQTFPRNYALELFQNDDGEWDFWPRKIDAPDRSYTVDDSVTEVPGDLASDGVQKRCKCGYPAGEQRRPLDKKAFFEYAENLAQRYDEFGIEFHRPTFFTELDALKSDPSEQFADDRLYEEATIRAIIHERRLQRRQRA